MNIQKSYFSTGREKLTRVELIIKHDKTMRTKNTDKKKQQQQKCINDGAVWHNATREGAGGF